MAALSFQQPRSLSCTAKSRRIRFLKQSIEELTFRRPESPGHHPFPVLVGAGENVSASVVSDGCKRSSEEGLRSKGPVNE